MELTSSQVLAPVMGHVLMVAVMLVPVNAVVVVIVMPTKAVVVVVSLHEPV